MSDPEQQPYANFQYEIYAGGLAGQGPEFPVDSAGWERAFREAVPAQAHDYVAGAAGSEDTLQAKALREAVGDAQKKAEALAVAAGVILGRVTAITEGFSGGAEPYYSTDLRLAKSSDAPIEPGTQDTRATVSVTFAIA